MANKRILVTGPESSGTKMVCALLRQAGAVVTHSSPNYKSEQDSTPHDIGDFDDVVLVVRNGFCNMKSMLDAGHAESEEEAAWMIGNGLKFILTTHDLWTDNLHVVTYESLVHEEEALLTLCKTLGLDASKIVDKVGDGNAKYYGGEYFRDQRDLHHRE